MAYEYRSRRAAATTLLMACLTVCTACNAGPSSEDIVARKARAESLYAATFGADAPDATKLDEAFEVWSELAHAGDARAHYFLSAAYFHGIRGHTAVDSKRAIEHLEAASEKGLPEAQFALAWQLEQGEYVVKNDRRALEMYGRAADAGYGLAMSRLVRVYTAGELGERPDASLADSWRNRMAAESQ